MKTNPEYAQYGLEIIFKLISVFFLYICFQILLLIVFDNVHEFSTKAYFQIMKGIKMCQPQTCLVIHFKSPGLLVGSNSKSGKKKIKVRGFGERGPKERM